METLISIPWFAWIALVAITGILALCLNSIVCATHAHLERMERIRLGLPAAPGEEDAYDAPLSDFRTPILDPSTE